ncbi:MAG: hypothetical protein FWD52_07215, partial [Candidatus Bathyarchaeota archaeon]|nr:hypothetical protein [Candidatus Termiticorpusculum sp.]
LDVVVLQKIGHDLSTVIVAATCEVDGSETTTCSRCDYLDVVILPKLEHDWSEWELVTPPSFEAKGQMKRECTICGATEWKDIEPIEWTPATKDDAYGTKIASSAQHYYPGEGVEFWWGYQGANGLQSENGLLIIDASFFEKYESVTIVVKSSASIQYLKATIEDPGAYSIVVPKWADDKGKEHNINMVWIRFGDLVASIE